MLRQQRIWFREHQVSDRISAETVTLSELQDILSPLYVKSEIEDDELYFTNEYGLDIRIIINKDENVINWLCATSVKKCSKRIAAGVDV